MPLPAIPLLAGAAHLLRVGATAAYNHFFVTAVTAAAVNRATDNGLVNGVLAAGDAVIGPENMRRVGNAVHSGVTYVGEGFIGAGEAISHRYGTEAPPPLPVKPAAQIGALIGSAAVASGSAKDVGIAFDGSLGLSFSDAVASNARADGGQQPSIFIAPTLRPGAALR